MLALQLAQRIPAPAFQYWNKLLGCFAHTLPSAFHASSGALGSIVGTRSTSRTTDSAAMGTSPVTERESQFLGAYGMNEESFNRLNGAVFGRIVAEDTTGVNEEALLCLKKGPVGLWGTCEDMAQYARDLVDAEKQRRTECPQEPPLQVRVFFAESDRMVGQEGQRYFDKCFHEAPDPGGVVQYTSTVTEADHDNIISTHVGVLTRIFHEIHGLSG